MRNTKENQSVTLEALLRLKRDEQPDGQFWDSFENDFQRRRLNTLVERESFKSRLRGFVLKGLAVGVPAMAAVAFSVFWVRSESPVLPLQEESIAGVAPELRTTQAAIIPEIQLDQAPATQEISLTMNNSRLSRQFVVDAIKEEPSSSMPFRKVLYTPAIHISAPIGASYVRDNLSSSAYQVTTADLKVGRNF